MCRVDVHISIFLFGIFKRWKNFVYQTKIVVLCRSGLGLLRRRVVDIFSLFRERVRFFFRLLRGHTFSSSHPILSKRKQFNTNAALFCLVARIWWLWATVSRTLNFNSLLVFICWVFCSFVGFLILITMIAGRIYGKITERTIRLVGFFIRPLFGLPVHAFKWCWWWD